MKFKMKKCALMVALATSAALPSMNSQAAGTITFGEDKSISIGFGMIGSFSSVEDGAGNGSSRSNDFDLNSARINISASLNKYIKGILTTEKDIAGEGFQVIDAAGIIQFTPNFSIWAGRFLSPSDRANMAGPYYSLGGNYWASIASRYGFNGGYIGRDDGVAVVGDLVEGRLSYSFGVFEGNTAFKISPVADQVASVRGSDGLMYAGRLQYNFWDLEPGYYGTGNYLGAKDILAIGIAGRTQNNGAVSATEQGKYSSYSIDFLLEKRGVGPGAISLEAAYYDYDTDDVFLSEQGKAYSAGAGYIFNEKVGWGQFQPFVRYQRFDADSNVDTKKYDLGVAYIIDGYNAQVSGFYSKQKTTGISDADSIVFALQLQF
ncbi:porin [Methylobacillus arboreus]|uniref:porin n=1 Tax=Methylobacillus arboreus TaxID=755170 RepID=UPI001E43FE80|nr:porin [Methylobacillus arboreus]MCB5189496.1 porin [Methylobacillus arboreus]